MLELQQDTSSEDGLSVVRTLFDKIITFYKLSESLSLPQRKIVELTVKFLLDGENLEDRQHAVKLLEGKYICHFLARCHPSRSITGFGQTPRPTLERENAELFFVWSAFCET